MISLLKNIGINETQKRRVQYLWGLRFLYQVGFIFSWTALTALFLESWGAENILLLFLADAGLFLISSVIASFFFTRVRGKHFLLGSIGLTLGFLGLAYVFHSSEFWCFALALVAKDFFYSQLNIAIYRKTESLFSPLEAQQAMPVVDSAITIGIVVGAGLFLGALEYVNTMQALALWGMPLVLIMSLVVMEPRLLGELPNLHEKEELKEDENGILNAMKAIKVVPFLQVLALVVVLDTVLLTLTEITFLRDLTSHIQPHVGGQGAMGQYLQASLLDGIQEKAGAAVQAVEHGIDNATGKLFLQKSLAHDLGMFNLIVGVLALFVQLFMTSRMLNWLGVVGTMVVYFGGFLVMIGGVLYGASNINFLRGYRHGAHVLFGASYHLTFYSIFTHKREVVRHFLEGVVRPLGVLVGLGALVGIYTWAPGIEYWVMAGVLAGVLLLCMPMRRFYTALSHKNLKSNQNIIAKLHSIEVLSQKGHENAALLLAEELLHKENHPIIREKLVATLSRVDDPRTVRTYLQILIDNEETLETKIKILDSLLHIHSLREYWPSHAFGQYHLIHLLRELLQHENKHVQKLAVMNIFMHLPSHEVAPFFLELINHEDEWLKGVCLRSCQLFNDPEVAYYIRPYLQNKNSRLRGNAVIALWNFENQSQLRKIMKQMLGSEDQDTLVSGLYAVGETKDKGNQEQIYDFVHAEDGWVRLHALLALVKLGNQGAVEGLLEILMGMDKKLANAAYHMLDRVPEEMRDHIKKELQHEVSRRVWKLLAPCNIRKQTKKACDLPQASLAYLRQLYRLAERYDDLLFVERLTG